MVHGLETLTLAYAKWNRDLVTLIDPQTECELADIYPVDVQENAKRPAQVQKDTEKLSAEDSGAEENFLPPFLAHLMDEHRRNWRTTGVVPLPKTKTFQDTRETML